MLDINIKGDKDGIWLAEQIRKTYHIPFIFLSAYSDVPTIERAANTHPYGYLVKPFNKADIFTAIEIALKNYAYEKTPLVIPEQNADGSLELLINQFIFVKDNMVFKKIATDDIQFVQAYKNYIELSLKGQRIVIRSTLQRFLHLLPNTVFFHVHRSFVVNAKYVEAIGSDFIMIGETKIPMSKSHKDDFLKKFNFFA